MAANDNLPEPRVDLVKPPMALREVPAEPVESRVSARPFNTQPTIGDIMRISWRQLRPLVLMVGSVLTGAGVLPEGVTSAIVENAEVAVSAVLGLWSATAFLRNRNDAKEKTE